MTFKEFVHFRYHGRNSPMGELDNTIREDKNFPDTDNQNHIITYLSNRGESKYRIGIFCQCWRSYQRWLEKRNSKTN